MTVAQWQAVLCLVAFAALLRVIYVLAWRIPQRDAALHRHPAGYRTREQETQR